MQASSNARFFGNIYLGTSRLKIFNDFWSCGQGKSPTEVLSPRPLRQMLWCYQVRTKWGTFARMYVRAYYLQYIWCWWGRWWFEMWVVKIGPAHSSEGRVTFSTTFQNGFLGLHVKRIRLLPGRELDHLQKWQTKSRYGHHLWPFLIKTTLCDAFPLFGRQLFGGTSLSLRSTCA